MKLKKTEIKQALIGIAFFLSFGGLYSLLIILVNSDFHVQSRILTIPAKIAVLFSLATVFVFDFKWKFNNSFFLFFLFCLLYIFRIIISWSTDADLNSISLLELTLYFVAFFFMPYVLISGISFSKRDYLTILWAIIIGGAFMALTSVKYFGHLIGEVSRVAGSNQKGQINPLILSYNSGLVITLGISYFLFEKVKLRRLFIIFTILISLVPFYLGASRGAVIAIFAPFVFNIFIKLKLKQLVLSIVGIFLIVFSLIYFSDYLGTGLVDRIMNTVNALKEGDYSESRLSIWKSSWYQFMENPLFGNSLENFEHQRYPHNIFFETLISTGGIGFFILIFALIVLLRKAIIVSRVRPQYFFIVTIFLFAFIRSMFSGAIYDANWLAMGAALLVSFNQKM